MNELDSRTIRRIEMIRAALTNHALTANELAAKISIVPQSAQEYVRNLLGDRIYIFAWRRVPGHITAVYRWGRGTNAPKPRAQTMVESNRARIKRMRKDGDAYDRHLQVDRARYARRRATLVASTWCSPLGGGL